jgi:hypothetical protein
MQSSTHKLNFPTLHGVKAWGTYAKTSRFVRINVCVKNTGRNFAVGAVAVGYNANFKRHSNLGAVAMGSTRLQCRSGIIRYTAHLRIYTFIANNMGRIVKRSVVRKVYG